ADVGSARAEARERAQLPAVVLVQVLEHVEVPVAAAHAEVVGVAAVPAVEEVVDLDRLLAEDEAAGPLAGALRAALDLDAHAAGLAPGEERRQGGLAAEAACVVSRTPWQPWTGRSRSSPARARVSGARSRSP